MGEMFRRTMWGTEQLSDYCYASESELSSCKIETIMHIYIVHFKLFSLISHLELLSCILFFISVCGTL